MSQGDGGRSHGWQEVRQVDYLHRHPTWQFQECLRGEIEFKMTNDNQSWCKVQQQKERVDLALPRFACGRPGVSSSHTHQGEHFKSFAQSPKLALIFNENIYILLKLEQ